MPRQRHPNPAIEDAIQRAESLGWSVKTSHGHAWGRLFCPEASREGCIVSVNSTPRNPEGHARMILRRLQNCPHREQDAN